MASKLLRVGFALPKNLSQIRYSSASSSPNTTTGFLHSLSEEKDDAKFDQHFINYFSRPEIDDWELRKGLTELHLMDAVPDPKVCEAAIRACRRLNDYSLTVRFLESIRFKCRMALTDEKKVYAYIMNELKPLFDELGLSTIEELGYDKPELFTPNCVEHWEQKWYKDYGYDKFPNYKINFEGK